MLKAPPMTQTPAQVPSRRRAERVARPRCEGSTGKTPGLEPTVSGGAGRRGRVKLSPFSFSQTKSPCLLIDTMGVPCVLAILPQADRAGGRWPGGCSPGGPTPGRPRPQRHRRSRERRQIAL